MRHIKYFTIVLILWLLVFNSLGQSQAYITNCIEEININSYRAHFDSLRTLPHHSRKVMPGNCQSDDHDACRDYIFRSFKQYLGNENVYLHHFEKKEFMGLANVIGVKKGSNPNAGIWVISAHYDSNNSYELHPNNSNVSPGANDNGTGLAAILEIARVLSNIETEATVIFAAWDFEEIFFNGFPSGSNTWFTKYIKRKKETEWNILAKNGKINKHDIRGNINFDMFGNPQLLNDNEEPVLWVCYAVKRHVEFSNNYATTVNKHTPQIEAISHGPLSLSDHKTFAARKIPAILILEANFQHDQFYHTYSDHVENAENIDFDFAMNVCRGGLAFLMKQILANEDKVISNKKERPTFIK